MTPTNPSPPASSPTGAQPQLLTLGGLELRPGFRRAKPLLALVYAALAGPTPRRALAELLWPRASLPDNSLRVALHSVRRACPAALSTDDPVEVALSCDALALGQLPVQEALALYRGPFLLGIALEDVSVEFEEWVYAQRERLAGLLQTRVLEAAERASSLQAAADLAGQAYRVVGAAPDLALLRRLLALTLPGSALERELRAAVQAASDESEEVQPALPGPSPRLRARLLGRAEPLDRLLGWAAPPGGGLAVISGVGGIGKSSLGRELLRELELQGRAVTQVDAEGVRQSSELLPRLNAARAPAAPLSDQWSTVGKSLGERPVVLLDGLDSLEDLSVLYRELERHLGHVRWVLTCRRRRLGLPDLFERPNAAPEPPLYLHLDGLDTPPPDAERLEILSSPAVQLFAREAARHRRDFQITAGNAALVAGITRRLLGHPLALALAASWLRAEPLEEVYQRILVSAATLREEGATPARRGLNLIAEQSWELLSPEEQTALLRLSTFTDFLPDTAAALGIAEGEINALLDHTFLEAYQPGSERLRLYPALLSVVQAFGAAHPELLAQARRVHTDHYLHWLETQSPTSAAVAEELGNLHLAVEAALKAGTLQASTLNHLLAYYDHRSQHHSGTDLFAHWSDLAEDFQTSDDVQAAAQIACMWLAQRADRLLDAQTLALRFLSSPLALNKLNRMKVLNTLGTVRKSQGQLRVSAELTEQAYELAKALGDELRQSMYLNNLLGLLVKLA